VKKKKNIKADHKFVTSDFANLKKEILNITNNRGVDIIYDTVGSPIFNGVLSLLADGGTLIEISSPKESKEVTIDLIDFYRRNLNLKGFNSLSLNVSQASELIKELKEGFENGVLTPPEDKDIQSFKFEEDKTVKQAFKETAVGNRSVFIP